MQNTYKADEWIPTSRLSKIHAIVLCAGYGTRLYPLTKDTPKPLITVAGKPLVEHILEKLYEMDAVDQITLVTNHRFYGHFQEWKATHNSGKPIHILNDQTTSNEDRLGAVGDLNLAINQLNIVGDVLLIGGDNLFDFSLQDMHSFATAKQSSVIALYDMLHPSKVAGKFGVAIVNENQKIEHFQEKPADPQSTLASTLCYYLSAQDVKRVKEFLAESGKFDNAGDLVAWLSKQEPGVHGFTFSGHWFDIGSHESLQEARDRLGGE